MARPDLDKYNLIAVMSELERARSVHAPFNSAHEGYAVILEEIDELWEEVKKRRSQRSRQRMRDEAQQIAAMAIRFMTDICDAPTTDNGQRTTDH